MDNIELELNNIPSGSLTLFTFSTLYHFRLDKQRNTPEPSKTTWQAEDTVFTLRSAYNYEIDLSERDFQVLVVS